MVTPVDFHTPDNLLSKWVRHLDMALIRRAGNISGAMLTGLFLSLVTFRLMHQKYVGLLDHMLDAREAESFVRMEKWIFDSPDQAAGRLPNSSNGFTRKTVSFTALSSLVVGA
jgi:polyhydroxyalkanoate synthase